MCYRFTLLLLALLAAGTLSLPCAAQQGFAGTWDVVKAEDAPWLAARPELKPHAEPMLRRARFVFRADRVVAPAWMGCKAPQYEMMALGFDALFEGGLSDPEHGLTDPKKLATQMGFTTEPVPSMLTGCSEMLFHLVNPNTVVFGLNNRVYTLKRHGSS